MKLHKSIVRVMVPLLLFYACSSPEQEDEMVATAERHTITEEQKNLAEIELGEVRLRPLSAIIACTGEIEVPPQGMASVTAPYGGYIVRTDIVPGVRVRKGGVLATLSNPEYIVLQQSYLETVGQLKFAGQDFERQKSLVEQNAAAVRKLQESESSYEVLKARLAGLAGQLRLIGVDMQNLEKGNIQPEIALRAPLSGFVTEVNHHPGQFVEPREVIFHIVNPADLHLHLDIFEKDVSNVRSGQSIRFRPTGGNGDTYLGKVSLISPQRNAEVRTFDVHGHIEREDDRLKPGMYVQAEILLSADSVYSVEERAVVNSGNQSYLITAEGKGYNIVRVDTGVIMDGWVEIKNHEALQQRRIVVKGASRLFTALKDQ